MTINYPSAYFTLLTNVLPAASLTPNTFGALIDKSTKQSFMWSNIDLLSIMGNDMFTKYKYFNITLVNAYMSIVGNLPSTYDSRICQINMKGLDFQNCSYSITQKCKSNTTQMGYFNMLGANNFSPVTANSYIDSKMFILGDRYVNLYISLNSIMTGDLILEAGVNTGNFPAQTYSFRIDPIEGY